MKVNSIYIHIPFCLRKCNYCDFVSYPQAEYTALRADYSQLLISELGLYADIDLSAVQTIYFGGGTPSLLEPAEIADILRHLPQAEEITLEANPETLNREKLAGFLAAGINRLSIGVQSLQPHLLTAMGRGHSAAQAVQAVETAAEIGFKNISIDLIYGLPRQTLAEWQDDLQQALALPLQHISLYCLSLEEDTPWTRMAGRGELPMVDDDLAADMFELAVEKLAANGFAHYEISNFARSGFESRHNLSYWQRKNYLGLGVGAAGCLLNHRIYNEKDPQAYAQKIAKGELPVIDQENLTIEQVIAEAVFLGLRMMAGIDFAAFSAQYGVDPRQRFKREIANMAKQGLLLVDDFGMRLSARGVLLGNEVFRAFV